MGRIRATLLAAAAVGLVWGGVALGARVSIFDQERVLRAKGPTLWDASVAINANGCQGSTSDPVYTPVYDGQSAAGNRFRDDAFDNGMVILVDGTEYYDADGIVTAKGESVTTDARNTASLSIRRTDTALSSGPILRSLVRMKAVGSAFNGTVTLDSNLGSDGFEDTRATASGDESFTTADRWFVSSEPPPLETGEDPAVTEVLYGKGASRKASTIVSGPGTGCVTVDFDLSLAPGKTRYLLFFAEINPSPGRAATSARKYNRRRLSRALRKGLGKKVKRRIVNWDLSP